MRIAVITTKTMHDTQLHPSGNDTRSAHYWCRRFHAAFNALDKHVDSSNSFSLIIFLHYGNNAVLNAMLTDSTIQHTIRIITFYQVDKGIHQKVIWSSSPFAQCLSAAYEWPLLFASCCDSKFQPTYLGQPLLTAALRKVYFRADFEPHVRHCTSCGF